MYSKTLKGKKLEAARQHIQEKQRITWNMYFNRSSGRGQGASRCSIKGQTALKKLQATKGLTTAGTSEEVPDG